jgi:hypothetical protein
MCTVCICMCICICLCIPPPRGCGGGGLGGPWTRDTGPYIYIQLLIHPNSTLEYIYIYTILMYSVCFVFSYRRTIMFIAFFFVFLRTCPGKLQGHHHDVYIRIALIQVGELQVLFEDGKIDRLVWYICVYIYTHTYMEKDRERERGIEISEYTWMNKL